MDSSEHDASTEQTTQDADMAPPTPATPQVGHEVNPEVEGSQPAHVQPEDAEAVEQETEGSQTTELPTTVEPPAPSEPGEPGLYWCDEEDPGIHPILGEIQHGENDYTSLTHPDSLQAIGDLVAAGVLRKA
jgi:hypothetical protein